MCLKIGILEFRKIFWMRETEKRILKHSICQEDLLYCKQFVKLFLQLFVQKIINTLNPLEYQKLLIIVYHIIYMFMKCFSFKKMEHLLITLIILEILPDPIDLENLEKFQLFSHQIQNYFKLKMPQFVMKNQI
ncbi:unnamed protein product [Paramecium sonneborni]|uniref:Uncharacterized protein n=1 Tax=Paramecium sonneborni TaxID=65129 RepID=A0A8S1NAR0_9CILI|nr:unnamed protein product [Paramecium sonneborni]